MKVNDIINLSQEDINKLNKEELFNIVKIGRTKMNQRLQRLDNFRKTQNIPTPIVLREWGLLDQKTESKLKSHGILEKQQKRRYKFIKDDYGNIIDKIEIGAKQKGISYQTLHLSPNKDDNINTLRLKLKYIRQFLSDKTSTVQGWKSSMENFYERLTGKKDGLKGREKLGKINYKRFWSIYNKVQESQRFSDLDSNQIQKLIYSLRVDNSMSMDKIEEFLLSNERIDIDEELEDMDIYYGGNND